MRPSAENDMQANEWSKVRRATPNTQKKRGDHFW
jgi:hypothetical protein